MMSFKVMILYNDRAGKQGLASGIGFSALIGKDLLFDTGSSGEDLLNNMRVLGVVPDRIEKVVISHDHWDHTGGLSALLSLKRGIVVYGCSGFSDRLKELVESKGSTYRNSEEFMEILPDIFLTGEMEAWRGEEYIAEQSLVLMSGNGISIITGCAHPGIVKIVRKVSGQFPYRKMHCIAGGFHLKGHSEIMLGKVLDDLGKMEIARFVPMHCTGEAAISAFAGCFGERAEMARSGDLLEL